MSRLLRANFTRLWKNKVFWGCMIFMFASALNDVISQYIIFRKIGGERKLYFSERFALGQTAAVSILAAIFIGLFIGTEYSNGTMRNKLVIGHSRSAIYFSNLAICVAATVLIHIAYIFTILLGGFIVFGNFFTQADVLIKLLAVSLIVVTAFAAMLLPISTHITSKPAGVTATIMFSFILIIFAFMIDQVLTEPEIYEAHTITEANSEEYSEPEMKNPFYVSLWSSAVIVVTTAAGAVLFRRKDLK